MAATRPNKPTMRPDAAKKFRYHGEESQRNRQVEKLVHGSQRFLQAGPAEPAQHLLRAVGEEDHAQNEADEP